MKKGDFVSNRTKQSKTPVFTSSESFLSKIIPQILRIGQNLKQKDQFECFLIGRTSTSFQLRHSMSPKFEKNRKQSSKSKPNRALRRQAGGSSTSGFSRSARRSSARRQWTVPRSVPRMVPVRLLRTGHYESTTGRAQRRFRSKRWTQQIRRRPCQAGTGITDTIARSSKWKRVYHRPVQAGPASKAGFDTRNGSPVCIVALPKAAASRLKPTDT